MSGVDSDPGYLTRLQTETLRTSTTSHHSTTQHTEAVVRATTEQDEFVMICIPEETARRCNKNPIG